MSEFTEFELPGGGTLFVQSRLEPPVPKSAEGDGWRSGTREASDIQDQAVEAWSDGLELVKKVAAGVVDKLTEAARGADEVKVEFGVHLKGKGSIILVASEAGADLKVTIAWKPKVA